MPDKNKKKPVVKSEKMVRLNEFIRPTICKRCGTHYEYRALGVYTCPLCGFTEMDEYGKIRTYLDEHGPTPSSIIAEKTGVRVSIIDAYLKEGRLEIPEGSAIYIRCERCGREIRYGRFCPECAAELSKELQSAFNLGEVGEVPKRSGKMHFLNGEEEKDKKRKGPKKRG